jgi:hypothetical protein
LTAITRTTGHTYSMGKQGPFPGVTGVIALQDAVGGSDGLLNWAVKLALDTVERHATVTPEAWPEVRREAFQAKNAARDNGSAIHAAVDAFNRGLPLELTDATAHHLAQYGAWAFHNKVEILGSERYVISPSLRFGGTYDSLVRINGETALVDVKSGKEKPSQRLQLAGLSMAEWHGEPGEEPERMVEVDTAYILLLRPDGYEAIRHDITDEDREHFARLVQTYHAVREWAAAFVPTPVAIKEEAA